MSGDIEISILVLTYNHENTIEMALEGILKQHIPVPYEILVIDDASLDKTQDILKRYKSLYPDRIRLFLRKYNSGWPTRNGYYIGKQARGNYIACMDGDDEWTNPDKIMMQYEILKNDETLSAVTCDCKVEDESGNELFDVDTMKHTNDNRFKLSDYNYGEKAGRTSTFFYRNYYRIRKYWSALYQLDNFRGDGILQALLLVEGDIYQIQEKMAIYRRVVKKGGTSYNSLIKEDGFQTIRHVYYWNKLEKLVNKHLDYRFKFDIMDYCIHEGIANNHYDLDDWIYALSHTTDMKRWANVLFRYIYKESLYTSNSKVIGPGKWNKFINDRKPVILFGAGKVASDFIDRFYLKKRILFIADNDKRKIGGSLKGYTIRKPCDLFHQKNRVTVVITSERFEDEIEKQILESGVTNYYCYATMQSKRLGNMLGKLIGVNND